jgi:hypothetical protein
MPGGLLNIIGVGQQDVILTGNPTKTFWKSNYSKYTNFGMQKFRLEYDGQKTISLTNKSQFTFKFKRYGDLVADTYLGINLPHIWSPLHKYKSKGNSINYYLPYEFQWIKHIGTQLIHSIEVNVGGQTLQKYSGEYLTTMIERDFDKTKQELINRMTGNLPEFNDPANAFQRNGRYPNAVYNQSPGGAEPSIRGRTLYIPLNAWFNLNTKQAFPLVSLQYNELTVTVTLRPIYELFTIRDVKNPGDNYPRIAPNFNDSYQEMYNFLQSPPKHTDELNKNIKIWNADIHLISTYVFLGEDERRLFATQPQEYLIHDIHETTFEGISINERLDLKSMGLVSSWMWFARRDDAYKRNQWTNYTNWEYEGIMPSASRIPPIYDSKFNATNYLVTPSNETIKSNDQEAGYFPPPVYTVQSDETTIPGNTKAGNIIPVFEQQGSTTISNVTVGYQPPNLRTLQSDISYTEHMLPTFRQQGAHRDPSHIGYNPPSISIIEQELSAENISLDIKPIWNEQGANNAECAKCSDPAPTSAEPVPYTLPIEPVTYSPPAEPVTYSPPEEPVLPSFRLTHNDIETNKLDNTPVVSTNQNAPNRYNSVIEFSSNRSTLGAKLDISYGIFNKDVMNGIKWTPICISLSGEVLTSYEVLTRINHHLLEVQKHLGSEQSIYIQYFSSNSIKVDISINISDTVHKLINTISCDTSLVVDNIVPYSVDGSNDIIHHIMYGISDDSSLISNATIDTPNILDGSHTFVSKFIDISNVAYFGGNSLDPSHNTYIYITPKVNYSNSPEPEPEYNLAIFDTDLSHSYTTPAIHDSFNDYDSVFNDYDSVFNDYDSVFNDSNSVFNGSNSVNDSIFRNNSGSSHYINTKTGRYSTRMQRPTRLPTRRQVIKQPVNYFTPNTIDIFSSDATVNIDDHVSADPTDPFINYWGGNNCPFSFSTTGVYTVKNTKNIMTTAGIIVDGKYRENLMDEGIYNYIEKYTRTSGAAKDGLYCYNYTLDTSPTNVQPTGSINFSKFKKIELELTTISPPLNKDNTFSTICRKDERTQLSEPIGVVQLYDHNFKYRFDIVFMEERYNIIKFIGGNVGLVFSN